MLPFSPLFAFPTSSTSQSPECGTKGLFAQSTCAAHRAGSRLPQHCTPTAASLCCGTAFCQPQLYAAPYASSHIGPEAVQPGLFPRPCIVSLAGAGLLSTSPFYTGIPAPRGAAPGMQGFAHLRHMKACRSDCRLSDPPTSDCKRESLCEVSHIRSTNCGPLNAACCWQAITFGGAVWLRSREWPPAAPSVAPQKPDATIRENCLPLDGGPC